MITTQPIQSWTDGYVALRHRAEALRGAVTIHPNTLDAERWPRTTGTDAIAIAALVDPFVRALPATSGHLAIARRWAACLAELEAAALGDQDAIYRHNRALWRTLAAVAVHLASVGSASPSPIAWEALFAQLAASQPRNVGPCGPVPFGPFPDVKTYDDLWIAQYKLLRERHGVDPTTKYPRTTNAEVLALAAYWTKQLAVIRRVAGHEDVEERWSEAYAEVLKLAQNAKPTDEYAKNAEFWRALEHLAIQAASVVAAFVQANAAPRNVGPKGAVPFGPFTGVKTFDELWSAQYKLLRERRGVDATTKYPLTTNAEVVTLADYWTKQLGAVKRVSGHDGAKAAWDAAIADVNAIAKPGDPNAVYPKNNTFWRALETVAIQVATADEAPTDWDRFVDAVGHSVTHLPENLAAAAQYVAGGAGAAASAVSSAAGKVAGAAAGGFLGALKTPLLVGAGLVGAYLLLRNRDDEPRAHGEG